MRVVAGRSAWVSSSSLERSSCCSRFAALSSDTEGDVCEAFSRVYKGLKTWLGPRCPKASLIWSRASALCAPWVVWTASKCSICPDFDIARYIMVKLLFSIGTICLHLIVNLCCGRFPSQPCKCTRNVSELVQNVFLAPIRTGASCYICAHGKRTWQGGASESSSSHLIWCVTWCSRSDHATCLTYKMNLRSWRKSSTRAC